MYIAPKRTDAEAVSISHLPSEAEYRATVVPRIEMMGRFSEPKYLCNKCKKGGMCRNENKVLLSNPPMYEYRCNACSNIDYQYG